MKRKYQDTKNKKSLEQSNVRPTMENALTVAGLKMDNNNFRISRTEGKYETMRGRPHIRERSFEKPTASFLSRSHNSLEPGELVKSFMRNKLSSSNERVLNQGIATSVQPIIRPALFSNTHSVSKTTRAARPGPLRAPFIPGGRGKGIPTLEDISKSSFQKVVPNTFNNSYNNKNAGKSNCVSQSTDCLVSHKHSNQSIKGVSPASNVKRNELNIKNTSLVRMSSDVQDKQFISKRSASIGPNSRNNETHHQRNLNTNTKKNTLSQSTGNLTHIKGNVQRLKGVSTGSKIEPNVQGKKCLTKATFSIQISPTVPDKSTADGPNGAHDTIKPKYRSHKNFLPVELTTDSSRDNTLCYPRNKMVSGSTNNFDRETSNDPESVDANYQSPRSRRVESFEGANMKNILYFNEVPDPTEEATIPRKSRNDSRTVTETTVRNPDNEVVGYNPEYMRSKRADSFNGTNTKDLLYGGEKQEDIPKRRTTEEPAVETPYYEVVQPDLEYMRSRRSDSFDGRNTKDILYGGPVQEDVIPKKKALDVTDAIIRSGQYKYIPPCVRHSVGIGGDDAKNLIYGDPTCNNNEKKGSDRKSHSSMAETQIYEQDHQANLRANRTACLGGDSMRNLMSDDHLAAPTRHEANFSSTRINKSSISEMIDTSEEDHQAKLRANRTACLGGASMKNIMCDDNSLKPPIRVQNRMTAIRENISSVTESEKTIEEEDHLSKLRANRTACLGGDSMKNLMCDDHLKPSTRNREDFGFDNKTSINEVMNVSAEIQAELRANRTACLGGNSMKNIMCDDHLEEPTKTRYNFPSARKTFTNEIIDISEEDHQAQLRANRTACLGGNSMRTLMCNDHLESPTRNRHNFASARKTFTNEIIDISEEDHQAQLRANRTACLGGNSMKTLMCNDHLEATTRNRHKFASGRETSMNQVNDISEEDHQAAMRANRTACLGGDSMKNLMCNDFLEAPNRNKKGFATIENKNIDIYGNENNIDEEDNQAQLRANRTACLGGESIKNLMYNDHLTEPIRNNNKKNEYWTTGNEDAVDEQDQLAKLRANRTACLGGESMRNIMCDDFLKTSTRNKDILATVKDTTESKIDFEEEDPQAKLRANRTACVGGESMRNIMCDDFLEAPTRNRNKLNYVRINESEENANDVNIEEEDHQAKLRANRTACLGGESMKNLMCNDFLEAPIRNKKKKAFVGQNEYCTSADNEKALKENRIASMGGSDMRDLLYGQIQSPPASKSGDKNSCKKSSRSTFVSENCTDEALKANRFASMGGSDMRNLLYGQNPSPPASRSSNKNLVRKSVRSSSGDCTVETDEALKVNRLASMGGSDMRSLLYGQKPSPPVSRSSNRNSLKKSVRSSSVSGNYNVETDEALMANRLASMGGSDMRDLLYGQKPSPPVSRSSNRNSVKKSVRSSSVSGDCTVETDEAFKANRLASMGGSDMRNLLYGQNPSPPTSRSNNRTFPQKSVRSYSVSGNFAVDTDKDMKTNRSASMGGSDMRNLLYGQNPSPPSSRSRNRTSLKKSIRSSSEHFAEDPEKAMKANRVASMGGSDMKSLLYGNTPPPPPARRSNKSTLKKSVRASSQHVPMETDKDLKTNRSASMGGSDMKSLLYGNAPSPSSSRSSNRASYRNPLRSSSVSGNHLLDTDKAMKANRSASMGGSDMKNLLYGRSPSPPASRRSNRTALKKSVRCSYNTDRDLRANRSSSKEGSDMKNLLYSRAPSPPVSNSSNKASPKKTFRSSDGSTNMNQASRMSRSVGREGYAIKSLINGRAQSPLEEISSGQTSPRWTGYVCNKTSTAGTNSHRVPPSVSEIQEENHEIQRANRVKGIGGNSMKSLIYGDTTISNRTGPCDFLPEDQSTSPSRDNASFVWSQNNDETVHSNRRTVMGGANKKYLGQNFLADEDNLSRRGYETNTEAPQCETETLIRRTAYEGDTMKNLLYGEFPAAFAKENELTYGENYRQDVYENPTFKWNQNDSEALRTNRRTGMGGANMKSLIYGQNFQADEDNSSRRGYDRKPEVPQYEPETVIRRTAYEGDTMKNLLYGESSSVAATAEETYLVCDEDYMRGPCGDDIPTQRPEEIHSSTPMPPSEEKDDDCISFHHFSSEASAQPRDILIPYDVLNQFAPECGDNIERTAVALKHGCLVDCTCRKTRNQQEQQQPCSKHIKPKELQFYQEASKVIDVLSSPLDKENGRITATIEKNLAREYPNYYNNFIQRFSRQLPKDYFLKEKQSKLDMITSCRKLLAEENLLSKKLNCNVNRKVNISGKINNLDQDFGTACKIMKKDYPALFVQLLEKYDFPSLAFEKIVVEQNRSNLIEISKLGPQKLQEFDNMFTHE